MGEFSYTKIKNKKNNTPPKNEQLYGHLQQQPKPKQRLGPRIRQQIPTRTEREHHARRLHCWQFLRIEPTEMQQSELILWVRAEHLPATVCRSWNANDPRRTNDELRWTWKRWS